MKNSENNHSKSSKNPVRRVDTMVYRATNCKVMYSMAESINLHSCRCEVVIIVNNTIDIDNSDICLNLCKVTLHNGDRKQLTIYDWLNT